MTDRDQPHTTTGAQLLVAALEQLDVEVVFGLPGVHNLPIWKALAASSIRLVGVRHEQTAVYAADGYARASGRLGVAVVTTGPGAANTLGATGEAMASGSPVLVIATDIATTIRRAGVYRGALHETRDQAAMFVPVTRAATTVSQAKDLSADTVRAGTFAVAAPSGPVYLGVPTDLLTATAPSPSTAPALMSAPPDSVAPGDLTAATALIDQAMRPLIWAGGGALRANAGAAVADLATALAAPVITTYMSRGLLGDEHPCLAPGPPHLPEVGALWDEADLIIAIGSDLDGMMTQNWQLPAPPRLLAINVDRDDAAKSYSPDLTLVGDARTVTAALLERVTPRDGLQALTARLAEMAQTVKQTIDADDPHAAKMLEIVKATLPADAILVLDMCIPGYWLAGFHAAPAPRKLAYPVGWGTLGFAFPASLGAALATGGRSVCICGDGGFLFACGELATAAQEHLPVTIVIVDDGGYGMLRFDQTHAGDQTFGVDLQTPDFVALAQAFGVGALHVDGFGDYFADALAGSFELDGPVVIVVSAALRPPPTTSPRWYRRRPAAPQTPDAPQGGSYRYCLAAMVEPEDHAWGARTRALHAGGRPDPATGARAVPIYQTTSFVFEDVQDAADLFSLQKYGNVYSRLGNPTVAAFEERVASLEGGIGAVATASGQAAALLVFTALAGAGDHLVASSALYGGTYVLLNVTLRRLGIETTFVAPDDPQAFADAIRPGQTKLLYTETIANPAGTVADFARLSAVAHAAGLPLVVDSTLATPHLCRPLEHGADIVLHSATKFLGGHGNSMGGVVVDSGRFDWSNGNFPVMTEPVATYGNLRFWDNFGEYGFATKLRVEGLRTLGGVLSPFNAFMLLTGMETLPLRMDAHVANAQAVARWLDGDPRVAWVRYPGLPQDPSYELAQTYLPLGPGAVLSFGLRGGRATGEGFIEGLELCSHLANIGDTRTLVIHPATTTHRQLSPEALLAAGVAPDLVRISVGIENLDDILYDLDRGLASAEHAAGAGS